MHLQILLDHPLSLSLLLQGFGSLTLVRGLYLDPPLPNGPAALFLRDETGRLAARCLHTGEYFAWGLDVRAAAAGGGGWGLKVSLAWTDPPATLVSDVVLVNDLDLRLVLPDGRHALGNNWTGVGAGGEYVLEDRVNNHEQV
jgi:hypothetical protein